MPFLILKDDMTANGTLFLAGPVPHQFQTLHRYSPFYHGLMVQNNCSVMQDTGVIPKQIGYFKNLMNNFHKQ